MSYAILVLCGAMNQVLKVLRSAPALQEAPQGPVGTSLQGALPHKARQAAAAQGPRPRPLRPRAPPARPRALLPPPAPPGTTAAAGRGAAKKTDDRFRRSPRLLLHAASRVSPSSSASVRCRNLVS